MSVNYKPTLHLYFSSLAAKRASEEQTVRLVANGGRDVVEEKGYSIFADMETGKLYRVNGGWMSPPQAGKESEIERGRDYWGADYRYVASLPHDKVAVLVGTRGEIDSDVAKKLGIPADMKSIQARLADQSSVTQPPAKAPASEQNNNVRAFPFYRKFM